MFRRRYRAELRTRGEAREALRDLTELARKKRVTLLFGARDERHNNAAVLKEILEEEA